MNATIDRQTEYLLSAWGRALRSGWEPHIGIPQNILARFIPSKDKPPPEVDDDTLQRVHLAFAVLESLPHRKNHAVAVWICYVAAGTIESKLKKLRLAGHEMSRGTYNDALRHGRTFMEARLTA